MWPSKKPPPPWVLMDPSSAPKSVFFYLLYCKIKINSVDKVSQPDQSFKFVSHLIDIIAPNWIIKSSKESRKLLYRREAPPVDNF